MRKLPLQSAVLMLLGSCGAALAQDGAISVKAFGAKASGGDDTAAILGAIKAAAADPAHPPLYFPPGTYRVSQPLSFPASVTVVKGAGHNATRIVATGTGSKPFWLLSFENGGEGIQVEDLYLDCANVASAGLVVGASAHAFVARNIVARCTDAALVLDGAQNAIVMGNDLRESKFSEKVVNGSSNCVFIRNEHELTSDTIQFVGKDPAYPCCKEMAFSGVPTQNIFGPGNLYADGGTYRYAIHVQDGSGNFWLANNITSSGQLKALVLFDRNTGGNILSSNQIQMGTANVPVVENHGYGNQLRGDSVQVRAAPNPACTTAIVTTSLFVIDRVGVNDNCFFSTIDPEGAAQTFITPLLNARFPILPPKGSAGATYFDTRISQFGVWHGDQYVDPYNSPLGQIPFPKVYEAGGREVKNTHMVRGTVTLTAGSATVTLSGAAAFQGKGSYFCSASAVHPANAETVSGTQFTLRGSPGDSVSYWCMGN